MGFFSFLKYTFIIFAAHLTTSCGIPFEHHCSKPTNTHDMRMEAHIVPPYYSCILFTRISNCPREKIRYLLR
jgi:hypothetical protein